MKHIIYIVLGIVLSIQMEAQTISGKIFDSETKEPIIGATIRTVTGLQSVTTNAEGKFNITIKGSSDSL
ncbi:carboxypeptidase-like regulatory domain-containing protein, partial [Escherichia fergusonii]|uniref:carboxypeptidase-like regulatory domain-containing protein n=1 Tax=Escherichia fergusonii TaxID=564 RepID=UPI001CC01BF9